MLHKNTVAVCLEATVYRESGCLPSNDNEVLQFVFLIWGCVLRKEEFEAVMMSSELPYTAKLLYVYLRHHMDYASGVVGSAKRKISYIGIREHLEYLPPACSRDKPIRVTLDKARGLIGRLESLGVIVAVHNKSVRGCMVFFLPLARPELVCAQDEAHMRPTSQTPILEGIVDKLEGDEAHTSLYLTTLNLNNNITREAPEVSNGKIPSGWLPSIDMVNQLVMDFGFTSKFIEQVAFMFRIYWSDRGGMASSWNIKFYNHVKGRVQDRAPEFIEALASEPARH